MNARHVVTAALVFTALLPATAQASVDDNVTACEDSGAGPGSLLAETLLDPSLPGGQSTFYLAAAVFADETWLCVRSESQGVAVARRIVLPVGSPQSIPRLSDVLR